MRVLHVIDGLGAGGAETLLYRVVAAQSDVEHVVVCLGERDWYSNRIEVLGVPVHHLGKLSLLSAPSAVLALCRLIKQTRADVVQGWLYRSNVLSSLAAVAADVPSVWSIHCASLSPFKLRTRLFVRSTGVAAGWLPDFIINCSARSAELHGRFGYSKARGMVIHNGYDASEFFPDESGRQKVRKDLGIEADTFLLGTISRWNAFKNIPNLIAAATTVSLSGVPIKCLLIGSGLEPTNGDLMRTFGLGRADLFLPLGRRTDIAALARAIDLHVLSSLSEAFPNTVAETMLAGTPNVVTDVGESALIVGETGWVVPPRDPRKLAAAIEAAYREWKERPDQWQRRRVSARERVARNFSFEKMAKAYHDVWKKVARVEE